MKPRPLVASLRPQEKDPPCTAADGCRSLLARPDRDRGNLGRLPTVPNGSFEQGSGAATG